MYCLWHFGVYLIVFPQKKSISNIQRNSSPSSSMKRPTTPYRYVASFLLSLFCNYSCGSNSSACLPLPGSVILQPLGALWSQWDPTAGRGLALTMPSFHIMRLWDLLGHPALTPGLIQLRHNVLELSVHWSLLPTERQVNVHTGINLVSLIGFRSNPCKQDNSVIISLLRSYSRNLVLRVPFSAKSISQSNKVNDENVLFFFLIINNKTRLHLELW